MLSKIPNSKIIMTCMMVLIIFQYCTAQEQEVKIGSGSTGGVYYPFAVNIATLLNSRINIRAEGLSTGGSADNCQDLQRGDLQMAMVQNDAAFYAFEGVENQPKCPDLRAIGTLYSEDVHIVVRRDADINQLSDMAGKRIAVGNVGSGQYRNAEQILKAADLLHRIESNHDSIADAVQKLKRGEIHGLFYTVGWPNNYMKELLNNQGGCKLLPLEAQIIQKVSAEYPFYVESFIPISTYNGGSHDVVASLAVRASLVTRKDMPDHLVYTCARLIYEANTMVSGRHKKWDSVQIFEAKKGLAIPMHPGAEAYFNEQTVPVLDGVYDRVAEEIGHVGRKRSVNITREKNNKYRIILASGKAGWIPKTEVESVRDSHINGYKVRVNALNFRPRPTLQCTPVGLVRQTDELEKLSEYQGPNYRWYQVRRYDGQLGWVASSFLVEHPFNVKSGQIKAGTSNATLVRRAKDTWLKGDWPGRRDGESLHARFSRLEPKLSAQSRQIIDLSLKLFEQKTGVQPNPAASLEGRLKTVEAQLDAATSQVIDQELSRVMDGD